MILNNRVVPCEGEMLVRTYRCGVYRSLLLGKKADGIVEVTNRRILFQARDSADDSRDTLHSEIPISEVSGLSLFKGFSFSIVTFLCGWVVSAAVVAVLSQVLMAMFSDNADSTLLKIVLWALALGAVYQVYVQRAKPLRALIVNALALTLYGTIAQLAAMDFNGGGGGAIPGLAVFFLGIVQLYLIFRFARRNTIEFRLFSRSTQPSPVAISGFSPLDAKLLEITRGMTSFAPGEDATRMMNELGAVVSDIQSMGDFGIEKWAKAAQAEGAGHEAV